MNSGRAPFDKFDLASVHFYKRFDESFSVWFLKNWLL